MDKFYGSPSAFFAHVKHRSEWLVLTIINSRSPFFPPPPSLSSLVFLLWHRIILRSLIRSNFLSLSLSLFLPWLASITPRAGCIIREEIEIVFRECDSSSSRRRRRNVISVRGERARERERERNCFDFLLGTICIGDINSMLIKVLWVLISITTECERYRPEGNKGACETWCVIDAERNNVWVTSYTQCVRNEVPE